MDKKEQKLETKRICIFLVVTFMITYGYCFGVIYPLNNSKDVDALISLSAIVLMFFPTIGVLFTRLITKEGFKDTWTKLNFKENIKIYLLAYFGPTILTVLGMGIYFLLFPSEFDSECGVAKTIIEAQGRTVEDLETPLLALVLVQGLRDIFVGPILNFLNSFGEEWGWRGYLLPKMSKKLSTIPMLLITGVIWGLWHAPLTAIGHNYGTEYIGFPFTGILAMCGFCTIIGIFMSYITLKSKSCIPAVLMHGAINSFASFGVYFTENGGNPFIGPGPGGIVGAIPFIIVAIYLVKNWER